MPEDKGVLRTVWEGKIPVCFRLASEEVVTMQQPETYYAMVPRITYFPLAVDKVQKHFVRYVADQHKQNEMWLEHNTIPLRWHVPVGVLFDLFGSCDTNLPWAITVHFDNFPSDKLLHCPSRNVVQSHFMMTLKEADAFKHRGTVMASMQTRDHCELWAGFQSEKFTQFWNVNERLMVSTTQDPLRHIPFRIYRPDVPGHIQRLIAPCSEGGEQTTLLDLLRTVLPDVAEDLDHHVILIHGFEPPLETPLQWLSEHLSHPDNFLHIVVITKRP